MFKILMTSFLVGASVASAGAAEPIQLSDRVQELMDADRPLVIAHRGYSMAAPENTIPAFELALLANADLVELDYYHSADGVPFSFHDTSLNRTSNAGTFWGESRTPTHSKSWEELQTLDAGSWFGPLFEGVKIPTLVESLDTIQAGSVTLIERKQGDAETLIQLLREKEILHDVVIQSFDWSFITKCNELAPGSALGALGPPRRPDGTAYPTSERFLRAEFLDQIETTGASVVGWNRQVTKEGIEEAHRRGLRVWVYTINDLNLALDLLEMGVDGIISDNPAMVWKAIALHAKK